MIKVVVMISGNGSNLQAIINKCHMKTVEIVGVVSDNDTAYGLTRALNANIPAISLPKIKSESRENYCQMLGDVIERRYNPRLIILAGFMRILSPNFVNRFPNRILNIHPSLLPKYKGLNTHQRVLDAGETRHGITIHLVTEDLDSGPILIQQKIDIVRDETVESLEAAIHRLEHQWYPEIINLLSRWITLIDDA